MSETTNTKIHFEVSTIETIDKSVLNFVKSLGLSTTTNKGFKPVPVIWGTAERAYQVKKNKEIRDGQGLLVLPLISIKRASFTKNSASPGVFQGNVPEASGSDGGSLTTSRAIYHQKTLKFANDDALRLYGQKNYPGPNPKVVYKTVTGPMPVNVEVTYEITRRTEYQQQMNTLITPFITRTGQINALSLHRNGHSYEVFIDQTFAHNNNAASLNEDIREFRTDISIRVLGYLIGEGPNDDRPIVRVDENTVEYVFPQETVVPAGNINLFDDE